MGKYEIFSTVSFDLAPKEVFINHKINAIANTNYWDGNLSTIQKDISKNISLIDFLVCTPFDDINTEIIEKGKENLKGIKCTGIGYNNIDIQTAKKYQIPVFNTPGEIHKNVADHTFALLLAVSKNIMKGHKFVMDGKWNTPMSAGNYLNHPDSMLGFDIYETNLLIVGLGNIGIEVCKRALGFNMNVFYYSRTRKPEIEKELGITYVNNFDQALATADFITICAPLTEETSNMFGPKEFDLMKESAVLVNTARGGIVDTESLYNALKNKNIAGAGVDVINPEPFSVDHPILHLENFIIHPHVGGHSVAMRMRAVTKYLDSIYQFLTTGELVNCVNM